MPHFCLEVSGPFACFTRPEMKVERVSYDVMTPSAARAVFESILWKPAIRWRVQRIEVLKPIRWINLRRNEVSAVVSTRNVQQAMAAGEHLCVFHQRLGAARGQRQVGMDAVGHVAQKVACALLALVLDVQT